MPRSVATLIGCILAALSLGFNIVRYPVVWEMAGPVGPSESADTSASAREEPSEPAPPPNPVGPIAATPSPEPIHAIVADEGPSAEASAEDDALADDDAGMHRLLAPVIPIGAAPGNAAGGAVLRRLPPVEQGLPQNRPGIDSAYAGSIPVYPTTGIE